MIYLPYKGLSNNFLQVFMDLSPFLSKIYFMIRLDVRKAIDVHTCSNETN